MQDPFGDIDPGPTKSLLLARRDDPLIAGFFRLACAKRQKEELFDLEKDPYAMHDVSGETEYHDAQQKLAAEMSDWMHATGDPRADKGGDYDAFDHYKYVGGPKAMPESKPKGEPPRSGTH